jgi:hypothetical protein
MSAPYAVRRGRPAPLHNGKPLPQASYFDRIMRGDWEARVQEFIDSGVKLFHLGIPHGGADFFDSAVWPDDGVFVEVDDPATFVMPLDRQANYILSRQPDAKLTVDVYTSVPIGWSKKYPGEMQTDETGKIYREASLASDRYIRDLARFIRHVVRTCEAKPWADHLAGYQVTPYGEGLSQVCIAGKMFDCSAATEKAFRAWIRRRYRTVKALRTAWGDPAVRFDTVAVPRDREWLARRAGAVPILDGKPLEAGATNGPCRQQGLFHWVDPRQNGRERDYAVFMRELFFRWVKTIANTYHEACRAHGRRRLVMVDVIKQPLMGWPILSSFDGVGDAASFPNMLLLSGSWDVGPLLDLPDFTLFNPADYTARTLGFAYESEGLTDSLVLRGKPAVVENDARCYVGQGVQDQGAFRTPREVEAGLARNAAFTLSRGIRSYWCNIGSSYYHDKVIHRTIRKLAPMLDRLNEAPHRETRDAIAMIIDDSSPLAEDFTSGYQALSVIWQRVRGLAHCGIPYRLYLLSDLERDNFPRYRVYLFPNLFKVDGRVSRLLKDKVLRDGNIALFGPGTGVTDGKSLTAKPASELLGVPMELHARSTVRHVIVQDAGHPITRELPASLVYGDTLSYGPTLAPAEWAVEKNGGVPLGHANACWFIHRTGLFLKEFGRGAAGNGRRGPRGKNDYGVVWSLAMPLPENLLRAVARHAGCHIWCEENDVVYASESIAALHSVKSGPRVLKLPGRFTVTDAVTGERIGRGLNAVRFRIRAPETRIFELSR